MQPICANLFTVSMVVATMCSFVPCKMLISGLFIKTNLRAKLDSTAFLAKAPDAREPMPPTKPCNSCVIFLFANELTVKTKMLRRLFVVQQHRNGAARFYATQQQMVAPLYQQYPTGMIHNENSALEKILYKQTKSELTPGTNTLYYFYIFLRAKATSQICAQIETC